MKRRKFSQLVAAGLPAIIVGASACTDTNPRNRIGMSTVNFRSRFPQTNDSGNISGQLSLMDIPSYYADRFQLHNVEFWSRHFESLDNAYLDELKTKVKAAKSRLINIQVDEGYQLGHEDPGKRTEAKATVFKWIDAAARLESGAVRINPGKGDLNLIIEALKEINEVVKAKGMILMTENHFGIEMDPDIHLQIIREVGENMYSLPDYGNYPDEIRYDALKKIMPFAYQVSAKAADFNDQFEHTSFDFDQCMKICVDAGFTGIYSVEQWSRNPTTASDEEIADWLIAKVLPYCD